MNVSETACLTRLDIRLAPLLFGENNILVIFAANMHQIFSAGLGRGTPPHGRFASWQFSSQITFGRAGFRRGQSGQLPRGPHKFWLYLMNILVHNDIQSKLKKIRKFSELARTHWYYRLFGTAGNYYIFFFYIANPNLLNQDFCGM